MHQFSCWLGCHSNTNRFLFSCTSRSSRYLLGQFFTSSVISTLPSLIPQAMLLECQTCILLFFGMSLTYWSEAQNIICLSREVFILGTWGREGEGIGRREHAQEDGISSSPYHSKRDVSFLSFKVVPGSWLASPLPIYSCSGKRGCYLAQPPPTC